LDTEDTSIKIQQIVDQLPAQCREIFTKSRYEDKSNEAIATEMNLSENTVKTQIYRALQKIRACIYGK
jgi:RNA polymerase sigma-70 factor (ECF subfamily)